MKQKPKLAPAPTSKVQKNTLPWLQILNGVIIIMMILIGYLSYKNISYPLLWNDEAETIINAQQITKYGYPKGHDEKNIIYLPQDSTWLGYKKSADANIAITWGVYYFAVPGVVMAKHTDDLYLKTALVRIPFVTAGLAGLLLFAFAFRIFFSDEKKFKMVLLLYLILESVSVYLFLHIREARYYSLVILITAWFFYVFIRKYYSNKYSVRKYIILMTCVLFLAYNINFITFAVMCLVLGLYEAMQMILKIIRSKDKKYILLIKNSFLAILPVILTCIIISPELVFFETFSMAAKATQHYHVDSNMISMNISHISEALRKHEVLYTAIIIKALVFICAFITGRKRMKKPALIKNLESVSFMEAMFFVLYILLTARLPFLWMRYFVVLQPLISLMILADAFLMLQYINTFIDKKQQNTYKNVFLAAAVIICLINLDTKENNIDNYMYQLSHQYQGPLDEFIPFIKNKYPHPENIVLATNYEELAYIYYLDCKVILGYKETFEKLPKDSLDKYHPDVLIFRKRWGQDPAPYNYYLNREKYEKVSFPVVDWPFNNIADLEVFPKHQFKTQVTDNPNDQAFLFFRDAGK